ncbi:glycosyl transferase, group 1 family protein [Cryptosporidium serpentis]
MTCKRFQIVFVASEVSPWSHTGGLGEVLGGIPAALGKMGHRVMCISPRWDQYSDAWDTSVHFDFEIDGRVITTRYFHTFRNNVDYVFVDHPLFLERIKGLTQMKYYGPQTGIDWPDNQIRFVVFSHAALIAILKLPLNGYPYGEECAIVCNDWHTALLPALIAQERKKSRCLKTCVFLCIHNIVFQGRFPYESQQKMYGIDKDIFKAYVCYQSLKVGSKSPKTDIINWLKGGIYFADKVLTVSKAFAEEIVQCPSRGIELDEDLRSKGCVGILNGLKDIVSPMNLKLCKAAKIPTYNIHDVNFKKTICKSLFQTAIGMTSNPTVPIFIFIGRFDVQKGCDVFFEAIRRAFGVKGANGLNSTISTGISTPEVEFEDHETTQKNMDMQSAHIVMIGSGIQSFIQQAEELEMLFPKRFKATSYVKGGLKYLALAAADFLVAPSRFEPCGLVQMEAMRFGCLPVCTPTGGFKETVEHMRTGIHLDREIELESVVSDSSVTSLLNAMSTACSVYKDDAEKLDEMRRRAIKTAHKFTLTATAIKYEQMFEECNTNPFFNDLQSSLSVVPTF